MYPFHSDTWATSVDSLPLSFSNPSEYLTRNAPYALTTDSFSHFDSLCSLTPTEIYHFLTHFTSHLCAVETPGGPCLNALTCCQHSEAAKASIMRPAPFDVLCHLQRLSAALQWQHGMCRLLHEFRRVWHQGPGAPDSCSHSSCSSLASRRDPDTSRVAPSLLLQNSQALTVSGHLRRLSRSTARRVRETVSYVWFSMARRGALV